MTAQRPAPSPLRRMFTALAMPLLLGLAMAQPAWAQKVKLSTSAGVIVLELDAAKAPKSVANFVQYVREGHYNGTVFHRVIDGFMIQGGGLDEQLRTKPTRAPIPLEAGNGLSNLRGTVAMARTSNPNSATSQFFINVVDNPSLDTLGGGYAVFGRVVQGMDTVDQIKALRTQAQGPHANVPVQPVTILKASLEP